MKNRIQINKKLIVIKLKQLIKLVKFQNLFLLVMQLLLINQLKMNLQAKNLIKIDLIN